MNAIQLTPAEIQSGLDRVRWAEGLIAQLPSNHDGRNSWLLNYGTSEEAERIRRETEQRRLDYSPPAYEPRSHSLIAAAPELLTFVEEVASRDPVFAKGEEKARIAEARALVAKATPVSR